MSPLSLKRRKRERESEYVEASLTIIYATIVHLVDHDDHLGHAKALGQHQMLAGACWTHQHVVSQGVEVSSAPLPEPSRGRQCQLRIRRGQRPPRASPRQPSRLPVHSTRWVICCGELLRCAGSELV